MAITVFGPVPWQQQVSKTGNYTVLATDIGTLFDTTAAAGAVTFTLPVLANVAFPWAAWFYNVVGQNMAITAPAGKLIAINNAAGTTCTFSTASQLIGSFALVFLNQAGTFYHVANLGGTTATIT